MRSSDEPALDIGWSLRAALVRQLEARLKAAGFRAITIQRDELRWIAHATR